MEHTVYTKSRSAAQTYTDIGLETGVVAANPHQLVMMLYEGAELAVRMAIKHMNEGDIARKCASISKASHIILDGLRTALDIPQGGDIAIQLDGLYDYMNKRLMLANLSNQTAPLDEVLGLLRELREAWQQIAPPARTTAPQPSHHSIAT